MTQQIAATLTPPPSITATLAQPPSVVARASSAASPVAAVTTPAPPAAIVTATAVAAVVPQSPGVTVSIAPTAQPAVLGIGGVAVTALSGHRVVYACPDGTLTYDDSTWPSAAFVVPGLTTSAIAAGAYGTALTYGSVTDPSWSWTPEAPLYLGRGGALTQSVPSAAAGDVVYHVLGVAVTPTSIFFAPQTPTLIA